jgi:hypothetical protein
MKKEDRGRVVEYKKARERKKVKMDETGAQRTSGRMEEIKRKKESKDGLNRSIEGDC